MKEKLYMEQLPNGDITTEASYQQTVKDILSEIFNRGQSQSLKDAEQAIEIKQIISKPISYISCDVFYEKRSIYSSKVPSYITRSESDYIQSPSEYDMWDVNCPSPKDLFAQAKNTVEIASSRHLSDCNTCFTSGQIKCGCFNGQETCPTCNGHGGWNCGTCGGRGEHNCPDCNGFGYIVRREREFDEKDYPIWVDNKYRCNRCFGSGTVRCGNCGGSGYITCGTCGGSRNITCRKCGGTTFVSCTNCTGKGYFINSIKVDQTFDITSSYAVINGLSIDSNIYGDQKFRSFNREGNDYFISEFVHNSTMQSLPLDTALSNQFDTPYDISGYMKELEEAVARHGNERRALNYRVRIYQQQVLEIEYSFQGMIYHLMYNVSTKETLMDKNPYENVAEAMIDEIKELAEHGHYKSFLARYKEFLEITNFDNISYNEKNIRFYLKKMHIRNALVSLTIGLVTQLIISIFTSFSFLLFCVAIATSIGASLLWKHIANDKKEVHYTILAILNIILLLLLNYIFSLF